MEFCVEERIDPNLNYCEGENPISKLLSDGWELVQLIPEYSVVELDRPRKTSDPELGKDLNITAKLEVRNLLGVFRR